LQLLPRLRTILHHGANLVENVQSLVNLALRIARGEALWQTSLTGAKGVTAAIIGANPALIAASATIGDRAAPTVARLSWLAVASASLTSLTGLALPGTLARLLAAWTILPVTSKLARLLAARLTLT
jgi:hypothetical protein